MAQETKHRFAMPGRELLLTKSGNTWTFTLWQSSTTISTTSKSRLDQLILTGKDNRLTMHQSNRIAAWLKKYQARDLWAEMSTVIEQWSVEPQ